MRSRQWERGQGRGGEDGGRGGAKGRREGPEGAVKGERERGGGAGGRGGRAVREGGEEGEEGKGLTVLAARHPASTEAINTTTLTMIFTAMRQPVK